MILEENRSASAGSVDGDDWVPTLPRRASSFERERNAIVVRYPEGSAGADTHGELRIPPAALRRSCRCAAAVDEITGEQLLRWHPCETGLPQPLEHVPATAFLV